MLKIIILVIAMSAWTFTSAQNDNYTIDVLIDADKNIYFEDTAVDFNAVAQMTRSKVEALKFVEGRGITYRIFAAGNLNLGVKMDVEQQMYSGFNQPELATRRYLLQTSEIPLDKSNWVEQLNKLHLKAID